MANRLPKGAGGGGNKANALVGATPGASVAPNYKVRAVDYYPLSEEEIHEIGFLNDTAAGYFSAASFWVGLFIAIALSGVFFTDKFTILQAAFVYVGAPLTAILAWRAYRLGNKFKSRQLSKVDTYKQQSGMILPVPPAPTVLSRLSQLLLGIGPERPQ